ncbi:MAG: hypothetical protein A2Y10_06100 [Planctomycetes bacterium GWF2_41_51]|nr:MAG: hypothetical protein A2Y10_06100 [Planctomycetes bacterium GWF2_41_51]
MKKIFTFLFISILFLYFHNSLAADASPEKDTNMKTQVAANTDFTLSLYRNLKNETKISNLFFSPYSISTALAMVYGGARGETQKQIANALHFTLSDDSLHRTFGDLQKRLIQENKSKGCQLFLANALWMQKNEQFLKEFLTLVSNYSAGLRQLDFIAETESSRQVINSWIGEKTNDNIKDLIPSGAIDENTRLILTNAIYFKGKWKFEFEKSETKKADFFTLKKRKIEVNMMHLKENFKYYADEKLQAVELPYKSNEISMFIMLPKEINDIEKTESLLTSHYLNDITTKLNTNEIDLFFPKFKITWGTSSLRNSLIKMGMTDAFANADFSGINGKADLFLSDVLHQAVIEVNEEGTEATAATGGVIELSIADEPTTFRVDHPFIFFIKDNRSGSILFMGRVTEPSK